MKKSIKKTVGIFIGLAIGLLLAEGMIRFYYHYQESKKNLDHLKRDQWRDRSHDLQKPPDTLRIAFFGDSVTYGQGVSMPDTFAQQTGEILRRKIQQPKIEILNFAIPAYNVLDNLKNLKTNVLKYDPDIIVYGYCINDFNNSRAELALIVKLKQEIKKYKIFGFLEPYSKLAYFLDWSMYQIFSDAKKFHHEWMMASLDPQKNPIYHKMEQALSETIEILSRKNGLVLILPILNDKNEDRFSYYIKARKLAVTRCESLHVAYLDIFPQMKFKPPFQWWVSVDDHHPNKKGHALIAKLIAEKLLASEFLAKYVR
jgi:lysophospholipase L1-like esterase